MVGGKKHDGGAGGWEERRTRVKSSMNASELCSLLRLACKPRSLREYGAELEMQPSLQMPCGRARRLRKVYERRLQRERVRIPSAMRVCTFHIQASTVGCWSLMRGQGSGVVSLSRSKVWRQAVCECVRSAYFQSNSIPSSLPATQARLCNPPRHLVFNSRHASQSSSRGARCLIMWGEWCESCLEYLVCPAIDVFVSSSTADGTDRFTLDAITQLHANERQQQAVTYQGDPELA